VIVGALVCTAAIPLLGALSDRVGRKPLYLGGTLAMVLFAAPYFWLLSQGSAWLVMLATAVALGLLWAPVTAVLGTLFSEIFSTEVRYTGVSLGYQLGAALAGGTAPLVATLLMDAAGGAWWPVAAYVAGAGLVSLVCILLLRETRGRELD
jgi:MFS family permease